MIIYYFTGTGNSLYVARAIMSKMTGSKLMPIASVIKDNGRIKPGSNQVGIVCPLYFGGLPRIVADFITKTDFSGVDYVFTVITAGHDLGSALSEANRLLLKDKKKLSYGNYLVMPDNYLPMFDISPEMARASLSKMIPKLENIITDISALKKAVFEKTYFAGPLIKLWHKIWIKRIRSLDKKFSVGDSCSSCGTCEKVCPVDNIVLNGGKPSWLNHCEQCLACIQFCSADAIHYAGKAKNNTHYHHPDIQIKDIISQKQA